MNAVTIIVDLLALGAILIGALMLFAQPRLRSWWAAVTGRRDRIDRPTHVHEDPVRYALNIFGMMLLAFGLIILGFFTTFALLT